jgi:signal transduction histidine kinase
MTALRIVQVVVSLSFLALGIFTVADWLRYRDRSRGYLALALATLGLTSALGQLETLTGNAGGELVSAISLLLFMTSGYALLLFRDTFIPLSFRIRVGAGVFCVAALVGYLVVGYPSGGTTRPTPAQSAALIGLILVWSACVLEPVVRFWLASSNRPAVQRARLRALAGGYSAIVFILLVAGFGGSAVSSVTAQWLIESIVIVALPLLLVGFAPPIWLRRIWRQDEIDQLRAAVHELVLFSPDRKTLAQRSADWAIRQVGAASAAIFDGDGTLMVAHGIDPEAARRLATHVDPKAPKLMATPGAPRPDAIVLPLALDSGTGSLVVVSGPFTPFFGTDEVNQLRAYTVNIVAALDRARVTERLNALDRMKSQFLNLASHELRSPLGVITGYMSMLEQGAFGQLKEQGLRAIEVVKAKTIEMNLLIAQMLDAARLEEGKLVLRRDHLDLREIASQAVAGVRPSASPQHQLTLDLPPATVPVFGDPDRLSTIITNLLENAVKYSPDGGLVETVVSSGEGQATLTVRDQGVGIAAEDMARLFNRFERLQNPQTRHVGGTGLGLYLSRELARQHGGDIEVHSEPGKGSTFVLTLPVTRSVALEAAPDGSTELPPVVEEPVGAGPRLRVIPTEGEESQPA